MAESGRKVWNEQQFFDLNDGAICRAKIKSPGYATSSNELVVIEKGETYLDGDDVQVANIYYFGSDTWDYSRDIAEWPVEVIWEPSDDQ